jgi:hypothetical protein
MDPLTEYDSCSLVGKGRTRFSGDSNVRYTLNIYYAMYVSGLPLILMPCTVVHAPSELVHISLPPVCPLPFATPDFFLRLRCAAKRALSTIDATVSTPPTIAHVLPAGSQLVFASARADMKDSRGKEVREGLARLDMAYLDGRDLKVEECA